MTLQRGDVVLTGTPKGVGAVSTGDVTKAGISFDGQDIEQGRVDADVSDRGELYEFRET